MNIDYFRFKLKLYMPVKFDHIGNIDLDANGKAKNGTGIGLMVYWWRSEKRHPE